MQLLDIIILAKQLYGDCGEAVNTAGCGPVMRGFESHQSPHMNSKVLEKGLFFCFIFKISVIIILN